MFWYQGDTEAPALLSVGGESLTYGRLRSLAAEHREFLNRTGIGRGDRVATITKNGPEAAVAFLTVSAAAVAAPLNPAYGARELEFYFTDLAPKAVLIARGMETAAVDVAARLKIPILWMDEQTFGLEGDGTRGAARLPGLAEPEETALLLHTSGTTSRPKLVPLTHRNLSSSARNVAGTLRLTAADRCLNIMPLFHIHGLVGAVLSSLSVGASVVATPGLVVGRFYDWLEQSAATWYTAVPTMHQAILGGHEPRRHRLRLIRSSSASLPPKVMAGLEDAFGVPVIESYGMTEASHQMASNPLPPSPRKAGSVGLPAGPEITVLEGEVCIRGENVTAGYADNPEANAAAFTNGWFRTGDQGYLDEDGYLFLTGRIKELINRGGEKIAPREIDEVLLEHPGVLQAVAFAVPHPRLGEDVGVAVVAREGATLTRQAVVEFCASRLADFKVPSVVKIVAEIPKGPTGKLQRIGLAKSLGVMSEDAPVGTARARTPTERALQAVWCETLRLGEIGVDADFFACGGDSLSAAQIAFRVEETFGVPLPLVLFRTAPTIVGMAEAIDRKKAASGRRLADGLVAIRDGNDGLPLFWVAGHEGSLLGITNLASYLPEAMPIYAFQPPREGASRNIESLASQYASVARAQQPEGPYFLAGHCFGGFVAAEMACRFREEGADVRLLTLVECFNPQWFAQLGAAAKVTVATRHLLRRMRFHMGKALAAPTAASYLLRRWRAMRQEQMEGSQARANREAGEQYQPKQYEGAVCLLAPAHPRRGRYPAPLMGWKGVLTGNVAMVEIPDDLEGLLMEPAVQGAGAAMAAQLARTYPRVPD